MKNELNIIKNHLDEIKEAGVEAYKKAFEHLHSKFIVWIDEIGEVHTYETAEGSNFIPGAIYEGKGTEIMRFCFKDWESEIDHQQIKERFTEEGKLKDFEFYDEIFCETYDNDIEYVISVYGDKEAKAILRKMHMEEKEAFIDAAEETVDEKLEYRIQEAEFEEE